ncbi:NTP transferase domain-containing protein [Phaeobacter inhibens]|uniref:NTP transferase domain-containing protein n=1 Tax=Phaeobacter inhibens TaxID=221822 RepID=UPI000CA171A3|nr:NTP transferase domain-containing protein [Phaeobacter inhibens]AUQ68762.1 hypothetical protein PhaeoP78_03946 [Phaeobacter inhibens]
MIVIPMAGLSSRFSKAGYDRPKWMLPLAGRPLLDWSLLSFARLFEQETFLFIYRETGETGAFIKARAHALGIKTFRMAPLSEPTRGQAETVHLGLHQTDVAADAALTIFNIDTIRPGYRPSPRLASSEGWLECFKGDGDHWSFVEGAPDHPGMALRVTEKQRISDNCSTGMYYFSSRARFEEAYLAEVADPSAKELFVAPLYQRMIHAGHPVSFDVIAPDDIFFSGTPDEYQTAIGQEAALQARFAADLERLPA